MDGLLIKVDTGLGLKRDFGGAGDRIEGTAGHGASGHRAGNAEQQRVHVTGGVGGGQGGAHGVEVGRVTAARSEEHTSELQSLMRISYAVFCLKKKKNETLEIR